MDVRFCDDRGAAGYSWIVEEPATRTSHALSSAGRVWLVDPVDWPDAIARASEVGEPAGVLQLLDRHDRDCAAIAERLGVTHLVVPEDVPSSPFACIPLKRSKHWAETALWWPDARTLVVAEAIGTNRFFSGDGDPAGVHLLLRLTPPAVLSGYEPMHLLVGHGEGIHGDEAADALHRAITRSRRGLPRALARVPALALDAWRRSRPST
jgi:hypothetical protein